MEPRRARVLVIDDEPKLGHVIARTLAPEYDVLVLTRAQEALDRICAGQRFELILCDLAMPGVDGTAFYERIRSVAPDLAERIVIMTGGAFLPRTEAFLDRTRVPRVEKPFDAAQLRRLVQEQLRRSAGSRR
jgi:CheY-like chemotaxis protein